MKNNKAKNLITIENIAQKIFIIRGQKIMLDSDLAQLYHVETRVLIQAVKRNINRFPEDFMFQLNKEEFEILKSQFVISSWGGRRTLPYAFTEQGVAMLSSVLRSEQAIKVNIMIMRTFVKLRKIIFSNKKIAQKIELMENKYDRQFLIIFDAIQRLMKPLNDNSKKQIGFITDND
jgi:hypothetical protein